MKMELAIDKVVETNALRRLDLMRWSSWHTNLAFLLGTGWIFDHFEAAVSLSFIVQIGGSFGVAPKDCGFINAVWPLGGIIGSIFFGWFCDVYGRRKTFLITLISYSICTVITAASPNLYFFLFFRALTAAAVIGEYSAVTSTIAEFVPLKNRGQVTTIVIGLFAVGGLAASALNSIVILLAPPSMAWRITFCCPALVSIFVLYARNELPESPRFLIGKGRVKEAEDIVDAIAAVAGQTWEEASRIKTVVYEKKASESIFMQIGKLFYYHPYRTAFACLLDCSQAFGGYGVGTFLFTSLLPLLPKVPPSQYPTFTMTAYGSALIGSIIASIFTDRLGRKVIIPLGYSLTAATVLLIYPAIKSENVTLVYITYGLYSACYAASWNSAFTLYAELFPTQYRSTGIGLAVACGRAAGAVSPILLPLVFEMGPDHKNFVGSFTLVSGIFLLTTIACIPWAIWGREGAGKSLEDME